jgi:hypothetical protein
MVGDARGERETHSGNIEDDCWKGLCSLLKNAPSIWTALSQVTAPLSPGTLLLPIGIDGPS